MWLYNCYVFHCVIKVKLINSRVVVKREKCEDWFGFAQQIMFVFSKEDCADSMSVMIIPTFLWLPSFIYYSSQLYVRVKGTMLEFLPKKKTLCECMLCKTKIIEEKKDWTEYSRSKALHMQRFHRLSHLLEFYVHKLYNFMSVRFHYGVMYPSLRYRSRFPHNWRSHFGSTTL